MGDIVSVAIALVVLSVLFFFIERQVSPRRPGRRPGLATDVLYWFVTALLTKPISSTAVIVVAVGLALASGVALNREAVTAFLERDTLVRQQPGWLQAVELVILLDFVAYWMHRAFHRDGLLWRIHSVHHSSIKVDWLSSVRVHPLNDLGTRVVQVIPLVLLGFDASALGIAVPFFTFYALFVHSDVPWTYGPLRFAVASPAFHRWHHTTQTEGLNKNFAALLPMFDLLFGTFFMPEGTQPERFGIIGSTVPENIILQLVHPFRPLRPALTSSVGSVS
ncbi:MAG: sterol desaturase family protein [Chloroflexi bacterium]|nr:sterol desaturase family protein [Chloroflexota bacterium]